MHALLEKQWVELSRSRGSEGVISALGRQMLVMWEATGSQERVQRNLVVLGNLGILKTSHTAAFWMSSTGLIRSPVLMSMRVTIISKHVPIWPVTSS